MQKLSTDRQKKEDGIEPREEKQKQTRSEEKRRENKGEFFFFDFCFSLEKTLRVLTMLFFYRGEGSRSESRIRSLARRSFCTARSSRKRNAPSVKQLKQQTSSSDTFWCSEEAIKNNAIKVNVDAELKKRKSTRKNSKTTKQRKNEDEEEEQEEVGTTEDAEEAENWFVFRLKIWWDCKVNWILFNVLCFD